MLASPERLRDILLVVLGLTTGATDATAFERLGHVFASVITGNLVLLGISAERADGRLALFAGCALAGYAIGVSVAAPRRVRDPERAPLWPAAASLALLLDLALLVAFAAGWELSGGRPGHDAQAILVAIAAGAMGAQSTAVRRLGQMSTTYLTSTFTGLLESLVVRQWPKANTRSLGILVAAIAGAAAATALIEEAHAWLPAVQLVPLAVVVLASRRLIRRGRSS